MFEKFTQKAIDVLQSAQNCATEFRQKKVTSSHLLLGLKLQCKGVQAKILDFEKIDLSKLEELVKKEIPQENQSISGNIIFSVDAREILKASIDLANKLNSALITPLHLALAIFVVKNSNAYKLIKEFGINEGKVIPNIERMIDKSSDIKQIHPENEPENIGFFDVNNFFKEEIMSSILSNAQSKITASGYEIMGTEQIMQAILDNSSYKIVEFLNKYGINSESFSNNVKSIGSRSAEFENSKKQYIFTPNAFSSLLLAFDCAKESGSVEIMPEHLILGILKSKKGIAYKILSELLPKGIDFEELVMRKMNEKVPATLAILRFAKEEALNIETSVVGTEMILLGILAYGTGVASSVLRRLGITLKDARFEVKKHVIPQKNVENLTFSARTKKMLEYAYETAQEHKRSKIKSENLLYAITKMPDCLAMKVLEDLGTDVLEIRQGIKQEILNVNEL